MKVIFGSMLAAVLLVVSFAAPGVSSPVTVDEPQVISGEPAYERPCTQAFGAYDPEAEFQPQLAVHPDDPNRLAVVWTQGLALSVMVGLSDNAGKDWRQVHVPISRCSGGDGGFAGDPWIVWGPDGTLHVAALTGAQVGFDLPTKVVVTRLLDGGDTWSRPVVVEDDGRFNDREALAVDPMDPDRLYLAWTKKLDDVTYAIALADSSDGGRTWNTPELIYEAEPDWWPSGLSVAVLRDGTALVAFEELHRPRNPLLDPPTDDAHEFVLRSTDRGATWTAVTVSATSGAWPRDPDTGTPVIGNAAPSLAIAPDGAVFMAWQDIDRPAAAECFPPIICEQPPWPNTATVWVSRSDDGGATWAPKMEVRSGSGQAWGPTIAAGPKGELVLTWYDTRNDVPGDDKWTAEVWSAHAHDDSPDHWTETPISPSFDLLTAFRTLPKGPITLGNYFGLAPIAGGFGAVFSLPASGAPEAPQDVVFTKLAAPGIGLKD